MKINQEKNKIIFVFDENGLDFEFAKAIIDQLMLPNTLSMKDSLKRGTKIIEIAVKEYELLEERLPKLSISQNVKCIYELIFAIYKLSKVDILSISALWCSLENLYYDNEANQIKYIILPVTKEIECKDGLSFEERLKECISFIAGYLPFDYRKIILDGVDAYFLGEKKIEDLLNDIKSLLNEDDATNILSAKIVKNRILTLVYLKDEATVEYIMEGPEITIGKSDKNVNIDFSESEAISRLHCKIIKQNQLFFIQDLDSVNHTIVNGEIIPPYELMELEDMDLIGIGDIEIRVRLQ